MAPCLRCTELPWGGWSRGGEVGIRSPVHLILKREGGRFVAYLVGEREKEVGSAEN